MILYVIRHAWAGAFGDPQWPDDRLRPLSDEGKARFARILEKLGKREFSPELIASSPLARCRQTAEIVAQRVKGSPEVVLCEALVPGSDLGGALAWTNRDAKHCHQVAWVGHAPDVGRITAALLGDSRARLRFAKGAVAAIRFPDHPAPGAGELRWLVTAKVLGC